MTDTESKPGDGKETGPEPKPTPATGQPETPEAGDAATAEVGGPPGPDPTRFGDWERGGRCIDF